MAFMSINNSGNTLAASNIINNITKQINETSERLSTGKRINSAADDPGGLAIVNKVKSDFRSWTAVENNLTSGTSLVETSNSALSSIQDLLQEMQELATQASSDNLSADQRTGLSNAFVELQSQIDTIVNNAEINGKSLIQSGSTDIDIQSGIGAGDQTSITAAASDASTLGVDAGSINLSDAASAQAAITAIDTAVSTVSVNQSTMGAQARGLDIMMKYAGSIKENLENARSRVEDANIAEESAKLSQLQVKSQAATAMLGLIQALPQNALSLLRF